MAASYDQMTCVLIKQYLGQCVDRTIALPQVAFEILTFLTVEKSLKKAHRQEAGSQYSMKESEDGLPVGPQ